MNLKCFKSFLKTTPTDSSPPLKNWEVTDPAETVRGSFPFLSPPLGHHGPECRPSQKLV